ERGRTHRAASDQEPAVQEGGGGDAPQVGRLRRPQDLRGGYQHGPTREGGCAARPGNRRRARRVRRRQGQREDARGGGAQDRSRLPAGLLPRREGRRGSSVRERDRHEMLFGEITARGTLGRNTWVVGAAAERDAYRPKDVPRF